MRITTRLRVISAVTMAAIIVLSSVLAWSFIEFRSAKNDYTLADAIKANYFERAAFRDQYFLYREDRAQTQWDKSNETADQMLHQASAQFHREEDQDILEHLRRSIDESAVIFHRIVDNTATLNTANGNRHVYEELDRRLFSQLLLRSTAVRDMATTLRDASARRVERTYKNLSLIVGLFAFMLALATILTSTHLDRLIRMRLRPLHDGTKMVAGGDLSYRIKCGGSDEFSELAQSINSMTDKLQNFTARLESEIGEHQQAEDALKRALDHLQKIASRVPGMVYQYRLRPDGSSCFPFASEAIREIYRVSPEEVREDAAQVFSILHPDDYDGIVSSIQKSAQELTPWNHEYRVKFGDGTVRWLFGNAIPQREADGSVLWHGFITDITERKRIEDRANELNRDFVSFLENTSDFIYFKDENGRFRFCSQTLAKITGHESWRNMIGKNDLEVFPSDTAKIYYEEELPIFREGKPLLNKVDPYYDASGNQGWVSTSKWPLLNHEGKVTGLFGISRDITDRIAAENAVQELNADLAATLRAIPDLLFELDQNGEYINIWANSPELLAAQKERLVGHAVSEMLPPEAADTVMSALKDAGEHGYSNGQIIRLSLTHGDSWFELSTSVKATADTSLKHFIMLSRDISERKAVEENLRKSEARLNAILDNSPYLIWLKDMEGRFIAVNKAFFNATGRASMDEVLGKSDADLWPEELAHKYRADDAEILSTRKQKLTEEMSMDNGEMHWVETFKAPIMDANGNLLGTTGFAQDITGRKNAEGKILHLAHYDPLTDLPNRTLFSDRLQQALATAKRDKAHIALMFIDLDRFKPINDEFGHHVGDLLLKEAAKRMQDCVRESDTVARVGGDEFVVLLPTIEAELDAMLVAEKIRGALNQPFVLVGQCLNISSSTGIAVYPEHGKNETQLVKNADIAMYHAKEGGRNTVKLYQPEMQDDV